MERGKTRGRPNTRITCRIYVELSDELDERDAFAWDHLPAQQKGMHLHWTCVLDTRDRKAAPTLPRFPVGRTTYEKYKEFASKTAPQLKLGASQGKRNLPSRRQRSWRHSIAEYRGGDSIAEGTVPRRQQYSGVSDGQVGLASLPWVRGPANIADFMTQRSHVLMQLLEHGGLNLETVT